MFYYLPDLALFGLLPYASGVAGIDIDIDICVGVGCLEEKIPGVEERMHAYTGFVCLFLFSGVEFGLGALLDGLLGGYVLWVRRRYGYGYG